MPVLQIEPSETDGTETPEYEEVSIPVLVVGAGAAGARTAIELAENGVDCLVVGKRDHGDAHTTWAAGGINAALGSLDPEDDWTVHAADTHREGHSVNDPDAVELVARNAPARVRELDEWGTGFDRTEDGKIDQRYFGAQSFRRTCFVGDRTGEAILSALVDRARELEIPYRENVMVTRLLSDDGRVYGAAGYDMSDGSFVLFRAARVVVAAGGYSALYNRHTSEADENTGDGPALAYDAGANLLDAEFVQFHPTGTVARDAWDDDWEGQLVTEAVRGEGGRLYNAAVDEPDADGAPDDPRARLGDRFMERYSPTQMELDARDVVARAIAREIREGRGTERGGVYLDVSHRDRAFIEARLPRMYERFAALGVDIAEEPMEVAPTAHYSMGGVDVDPRTGRTAVDGLYAVGESASGLHGANRLGGNSLVETVVFGQLVGDHLAATLDGASPELPEGMRAFAEGEFRALLALERADGDVRPAELFGALGDLLWRHAGILRDADGLDAGLGALDALRDRAAALRVEGDRTDRDFEFAVDLSFTFAVAEAILRAASFRTESRGAHHRTDFPDEDDDWRVTVVVSPGEDGPELRTRPVGEPGEAVRAALDEGYELEYAHLE
ncbi:L-aspartate oxidase [Halegenticoccus tardaugens]|uniref:L-aspartate oxidase n=1 Tax=Halegenticoccus tardaugens TaxID=2071624 RepID=UPI00100BBEBD|nr:FAD-dependent oxidoreductase [Halegenticoccus tardaugens]